MSVHLHWGFAGIVASVALYFCVVNWICLISRLTKLRSPSWVPLVPGILLALAMSLSPLEQVASWWWIAFLVDGGSVPGLLLTVCWIASRKK